MANYKPKNTKGQLKDLLGRYTDKKKLMLSERVFNNIINSGMTDKTIFRIDKCGDNITMVGDETLKNKKVISAQNCGNRFCAICSWRKARKEAVIISIAMNYIADMHKKEFIFLTLTAPNVKSDVLKDEVDRFNYAFKRLFARKIINSMNKGYVRKLEITYRKEPLITEDYYYQCKEHFDSRGLKIGDKNPNYDTYNLHFHAIIAVNKTYFSGRTYISQEKWLNLWRDCMKDSSITQVDVRKVSQKNKIGMDGDIKNVVLEVAKYSAKDTDLHVNSDVFNAFYNSLKGRQLITYNGYFKDVVKLYKQYIKIKDEEKREKHVIHKYIPTDPNKYIYRLLYQWGHGEYVEKEKRLLTESEQKRFNKMIVDDDDDMED